MSNQETSASADTVETGFDDPAAVYTPTDSVPEVVVPEPPSDARSSASATSAVTVAVTTLAVEAEAETKGLTEEGLDALKAMVALPNEFGPPQMVALARDLAKNIHPLGTILNNHKLTNAQYEFLSEHNEFFKHALQQLSSEWQGITSTAERLKHEVLAALEEQLPTIASRMGMRSEKLIDAVEAAKLFAKIGDVDGTSRGNGPSGERFTISIDLGADTRIIVGNGDDKNQGAQPAGKGAIQANAEGQGGGPALRLIGQGSGDVGST